MTVQQAHHADAPLDELYQEMILEHNRHPRNFHELTDANAYAHGLNPLCGDDYHLYLKIDARGVIEDVGFVGSGCAISKSSASLMTSMIKTKAVAEVRALKACFQELVTSDQLSAATRQAAGRLAIFAGVKKFPVRVKCAMLIWRALEAALEASGNTAHMEKKTVSTETDEDTNPLTGG